MSEEACQKAMLYFLEVLMNSKKPITLTQLAGHFGRRSFTNEMRIAAGGNELGLKNLLSRYPSIFSICGNLVALADSKCFENQGSLSRDSSDSDLTASKNNTFIPNVSAEMEAVRFFQDKFVKRSSREMAIKSLAGHLSQASLPIRKIVGPQLQFRSWLLRHPHIFEVDGENVKLQDDVAALILDVDLAENEILCYPNKSNNVAGSTKSKSEIMAIVFLGDLIKQHPNMKVSDIEDHIGLAPTSIQVYINSQNIKQFVDDNSTFFSIVDGVLKEVKSPSANLVRFNDLEKVDITEEECLAGAIIGKGRIYHIAKLWGIIDLGQHDHVFFDRSILPKATLDMKKEFKVGQILCFKALPAPKTSRAKWKAMTVWRPSVVNVLDDGVMEEQNRLDDSTSKVEEEIYRLVLADHQMVDDVLSSDDENMWIGSNSGSNNSSINNINSYYKTDKDIVLKMNTNNITRIVEDRKSQMNGHRDINGNKADVTEDKVKFHVSSNSSSSSSLHKLTGNQNSSNNVNSRITDLVSKPSSKTACKFINVACQTESTGEIIATQLYTA